MQLKDVIGTLDVVRAAMKTIPLIGGQLEGGVEVLLLLCKHAEVSAMMTISQTCWELHAQTVRSNKEDAEELAQQAAFMYASIGKAIGPKHSQEVLLGKHGDVANVIEYESLVSAV
jgi:hypothetical protein